MIFTLSVASDSFSGDDMILSRPAILRHCQLAPRHPFDNLTTLIEAETFQVKSLSWFSLAG